jgi:hypothetical protein
MMATTMPVLEKDVETLMQVLFAQGFRAVGEFDSFLTFERQNEPLKIHVGPDGAFAAFNDDDELVAEGDGQDDLYQLLVSRPVPLPRVRRA